MIYKYGKTGVRLDVDQTFAQNHVPQNELPTDGFLMLDLGVDREVNIGATTSLLYVKGTNLLNEPQHLGEILLHAADWFQKHSTPR